MLKDLPDGWTVAPEIQEWYDKCGMWSPTRVHEGVYIAHLNWNHDIQLYIETEYPFGDELRNFMQRTERVDGAKFDWDSWTSDYGVCDDYTQILDKCPVVLEDPRPFMIFMTPIRRADQPPQGGWRWHKWGPYIGTYEPQYEHLYDEDIEMVYVYHIVQLKETIGNG